MKKNNEQPKDPIAAIEKAMEKIVPMTGAIYARDGQYVVTWEDILCELQEFVSNGYALSDTAKHVKQFVSAVREHVDYMYRRIWDFDGLEDVSAVAEHITLHALSKIGIASINANPLVLIRAAITTERTSTILSNHFDDDFVGGDHLLEAVIRASTPNVTEDETQPVLNAVDLLLDERQPLNRIIEAARQWTKDPQWIADHTVELATARVLEDLKNIGMEGRLHRTANKSRFYRLGKFFIKLWQIFTALLIAPWRLDYKFDNFEEVFSFGPFILSYDVVVFEIPASIMNILYSLGQLKFRMALSYLFVFLLDTFAEVVSHGRWQFGHTHIHYKDGEGWSFHRHPGLRWRFNILGFNVGKGGIYLLRKCWSCDRRDFLKQNFRGPDGYVSKSHECDHCFALSDEQHYKQLELTPRMKYDQACTVVSPGWRHLSASVSWNRCKDCSGPRKPQKLSKHRRWLICSQHCRYPGRTKPTP